LGHSATILETTPSHLFAGAELAFAKNNVTDSQDKFNYLLNSFPWEILLDFQHELLLAGHSISPYEALKESPISMYGNNEPNCAAIPALAISGAPTPAASTPSTTKDRQPQVTPNPPELQPDTPAAATEPSPTPATVAEPSPTPATVAEPSSDD
jgi:hypothetical protein